MGHTAQRPQASDLMRPVPVRLLNHSTVGECLDRVRAASSFGRSSGEVAVVVAENGDFVGLVTLTDLAGGSPAATIEPLFRCRPTLPPRRRPWPRRVAPQAPVSDLKIADHFMLRPRRITAD